MILPPWRGYQSIDFSAWAKAFSFVSAQCAIVKVATRSLRKAPWGRTRPLEHLVLVFPNQPLTSDEYLAFAETVGTPAEYPFVDHLPGHPFIIEVLKLPEETVNFGGIWHADTIYMRGYHNVPLYPPDDSRRQAYRCIIIRGEGWQVDTLPADLVPTAVWHAGDGRPSWEDGLE